MCKTNENKQYNESFKKKKKLRKREWKRYEQKTFTTNSNKETVQS